MTEIVEYIGREKLVHKQYNVTRAATVKPGDFVDFSAMEGKYPYTHGKYGRIQNTHYFDTDDILICCEEGSCFLMEGAVSISGGPFEVVKPHQLEPTYELHVGRFWNWGNNLPGADKGVDYYLARPVFKLLPKENGGR